MTSGQIYQPELERGYRNRSIRDIVYSSRTPANFSIDRFASEKNLQAVWNYLKATGGKAPGTDGIRFDDVTGSQFKPTLRLAKEVIADETYCPRPVRHAQIQKRGGGIRVLSIPCVLDRVIGKAFQFATDTYWRSVLPNLGRDVIDIFKRLELDIRRNRRYMLAIGDIRNCYPETPVELVLEDQMSHFEGTQAQFLAQQLTLGHEGQDLTGGMGQGSPYSPVAVESFLHHRFDLRMISQSLRILLYRYVDDLTFLVGSRDEGNQVMAICRQVLGEIDYRLGSTDFIDLQNQTHTKSLLGLIPKWRDGAMHLEIGEDAYRKLGETLTEASIKGNDLNFVVNGWIQAYGPAITKSVKADVVERLRRIVLDTGETQFHVRNHSESIQQARQRWINRRSS